MSWLPEDREADPVLLRECHTFVFRIFAMSKTRSLAASVRKYMEWWLRNVKELFWVELVFLYEVETRCHPSVPDRRKYTGRWALASEEDINSLFMDSELANSLGPKFRERWAAGKFQLYVACDGPSSELAGYVVYSPAQKQITASLQFLVDENECFVGPYYIKSSQRGVGHATRGVSEVLELAAENGKPTAYIDIGTSNHSSKRVARKVGGRQCNSGYVRIRFIGSDYAIPFGPLRKKFLQLAG